MRLKSGAGGMAKAGRLRRLINRMGPRFLWSRRLAEVEKSLDEEIMRGARQMAEIHSRLAKLDEEVAHAAQRVAELLALHAKLQEITQPKLLKLESAWRQQAAAHRHMIELVRNDDIGGGSYDLKWALWDDLNQLHAQMQRFAEAIHLKAEMFHDPSRRGDVGLDSGCRDANV